MNRAVFEDALIKLEQHCEEHDPAKASSLFYVAISICDRATLHAFGRLATLEELEKVLRMTFARLRAVTGNATPPKGGIEA